MRRRDFLRVAGGALAAGAAGCAPGDGSEGAGPGPQAAGADSTRGAGALALGPDPGRRAGALASTDFDAWTWVHPDPDRTHAEWRARFEPLREAGFRGVLAGGGDSRPIGEAARDEGLEHHRWFWTCNRNGDTWAQEQHPEWFTVSRNLESTLDRPPYVGYYRWVCPTREPVRAYLRGLVDELAADPWIDGVHLDYVRHSDVILPRGLWDTYGLVQDRELPEFDFCYCDVCRSAFAERDGRDPLDIPDPTADEAWRRFRWDSVTGLVETLADAVHARGKPISAAVFPTPTIARTLVRQAWDEWPVDAFFPMLYASFYLEGVEWIGDGVRAGVAALGGSARTLRAGLYLPDLSPAELAEAVGVSRDAGAAGVSLFEMGGLSDEHLGALRGVLV